MTDLNALEKNVPILSVEHLKKNFGEHEVLRDITFDVPQVREGGFYPEALEKGLRSERALTLTLAEMYVQQGVSTRKVAAVVEQLCGCEVSSTQVSRSYSPGPISTT